MNGANASDRHVKMPFILNNDEGKKNMTDTNIRTEKERGERKAHKYKHGMYIWCPYWG